MSQLNDPRTMHARAAGRADQAADKDTYCRSCGYDLAGLSRSVRCPECGRPIHGDAPVPKSTDAPRDYLQTIGIGVRLVLLSWLCLLTAGPAAYLVGSFLMTLCLLVVGALSGSLGCLLSTRIQLGQEWQDANWLNLRTAVRVAANVTVGSIAAFMLALLLVRLLSSVGRPSNAVATALIWILALAVLSVLTTQVLYCHVGSRMAKWMEDDRLGAAFWSVQWGLIFFGPLGVVVLGQVFTSGLTIMCFFMLFLPALLLVFQIWFGWLLLRLQRDAFWVAKYQGFDVGKTDRLRERTEAEREGRAW